MKKTFITLLIIAAGSICQLKAQDVTNTSYQTKSGEKVLRLEFVLPLSKAQAWQYFTNDAKLKLWIAPVAHIDLKTGGALLTNYDKTKSITDKSAIRNDIVNYIENELITLKVNLNGNFTKKARAEDKNLQEVIQFIAIDDSHTKIVSSMIGWGKGADWDKTYAFFDKGNIWTYKELTALFKSK
ncbi:SRPBCC domain-containing protein [Mucilaginibacter calamicampi]|uniref:SRPBCC domain-containing protein n=1 Tax=Mucilaginibacter calamicampi TaxID=1302352 RepID=A0ABW2YZ95_9SPHI